MTFTQVQSGFIDLTTSSGLTVGAGNVTTPALNFGTSNTGFFAPASGEVSLSLSGSRIFTARNGNFGILTNSPTAALDVFGNTEISGTTRIGGSTSSSKLSVYRQTINAGNPILNVFSDNTSTERLLFEIDGDGDVSILGDTSSSSTKSARFYVTGGSSSTGSNNLAGGAQIILQNTNSNSGSYSQIASRGTNGNTTSAIGFVTSDNVNDAGRLEFMSRAASSALRINMVIDNDEIVPKRTVHYKTTSDFGSVGSGNIDTDVTQQVWYTGGGRHYIQLQANDSNYAAGSQDPAYIAWKGSQSDSPGTSIPNGGYMARIGGYRDLINNGSTSLCWESVHSVSSDPHIPTRNLTLRYNGRIGFGPEIEPACLVDMSQDTTAICLPKGTTTQRSSFTNESGQLRYNTENDAVEFYNGTLWNNLAANDKIISSSGDYVLTTGVAGSGTKTHFFHTSGSFANSGVSALAEVWVIGAGGGGSGGGSNSGGGGGGGGGMVYASVVIPPGTFTVTVGTAGSGGASGASGSAGGFSQIVIGSNTFKATGGSAGSGGISGGGGAGGTGTINNGTSYSTPAGGNAAVYGTGGDGGNGGEGGNTPGQAGSGTNGGAGGGGAGANNYTHNGGTQMNGGNGSSTYYTGGGGGGGYDGDGTAQGPNNRGGTGGTGYFSGGNGADFDGPAATAGGKPTGSAGTNYSGSAAGTSGSSRINAGGGGGAYGGGGGSAADSANSPDATGGQGGSGVVIIKYNF